MVAATTGPTPGMALSRSALRASSVSWAMSIGDGFITLRDLFFQGFDELPGLARPERIGVMLGVVAFADEQVDELASALGHFGQLLLLG